MRWVPNIAADRAKIRAIAAYRANRRLSLAAEWNPGESELLPNFNFAPSLPNEHIPGVGLMVGTSSDRIGTPDGRAWFAAATLDPKEWGWEDLPVNGYLGASYGTWANDARAIGGLSWSFMEHLSAGVQHDGENVHGIISINPALFAGDPSQWNIDLLLIEQFGSHTLGITVSTRF
ncbi:MAG: hypothetical protein MK209_05425 [Planctomycetes bacterium]|nr:hypothetical protein [Planctomycetota bacterium]